MKKCFFCQEAPSDTNEHVIPQWILRDKDLSEVNAATGIYNEKLSYPNGRTYQYNQLKVPACKSCNGGVWSQLEKKIQNSPIELPSDKDLWLWACKLYYGMTVRDEQLDWNPRNKGVSIADTVLLKDELEKSRYFLCCITGECSTEPEPFGSVFYFRYATKQRFHFIHFIETKSIAISAGTFGLVCFVEDGQLAKKHFNSHYDILRRKPDLSLHDMLWFYANAHYDTSRGKIGYDLMLQPGKKIYLLNHTFGKKQAYREDGFARICLAIGLAYIKEEISQSPTFGYYSEVPASLNQELHRITGHVWDISLGLSYATVTIVNEKKSDLLKKFMKLYNFEVNNLPQNVVQLKITGNDLFLLQRIPTMALYLS